MRILYDFDGTIVKSYDNITHNIYREVPEERKHIITERDVYNLVKINAKTAMDLLDFNEEQRANVYARQYEVIPSLNQPFSMIKEVLESAEVNVIMTHKSVESVEEILEYYGLRKYFNEIVGKGSPHFSKKPNAESYRYLHDKYHIDLVIGDRRIDLQPARELGITTCSYQNHMPEADYYIDDYVNFPLVVLGKMFGVKSHSIKQPYLDSEWLTSYFSEGSAEYHEINRVVDIVEDKDLAYLYKIGAADKVKKTGFYPLDSALYAMERGFRASTIKVLLLHKEDGDGWYEAYPELYALLQRFMSDYLEDRINRFKVSFKKKP